MTILRSFDELRTQDVRIYYHGEPVEPFMVILRRAQDERIEYHGELRRVGITHQQPRGNL